MRIVFGRKKGEQEDPFAALKQGSTYESAPTTASDIGLGSGTVDAPPSATLPQQSVTVQPSSVTMPPPAAPAPTPTAVPPSPSQRSIFTQQQPPPPPPSPPSTSMTGYPRRRPRTYGFGAPVIVRLAIFGVLIAVIGIPIANSIKSTVHSIKIPSFNFGQTSTSGSSGSSSASPAPPRPVNYLRASGLRAGLARVRRIVPGARLTLLRVDSDSLSVNASRPGHGSKQIYFGPAGTSVSVTSSTGQIPVPISKVNANVLASLVNQLTRRYHVRHVDYAVLTSPPGLAPAWILFAKTAAHTGYQATLSGQGLRPL